MFSNFHWTTRSLTTTIISPKVKVEREGMQLQARRGYLTPNPEKGKN